MPRVRAPIYSLNGGEVGDEGLARLDLERLQFAGSLYSNVLPRVIGSMTLRPGLEHVADIDFGNVQLLEYSYSGGSNLVPILSNQEVRIVKNNALVSRPAVSTAITNGDFASFTGWTNASTGAGASASVSGGNLVLTATSQGRAVAKQTISVAAGGQGIEHGLRVTVTRGPVNVRLGTVDGTANLIDARALDDGVHSIAFTPTTGSIYLQITNEQARTSLVFSCQIDASGALVLPTPWTSDDLAANIIRYRQSIDVMYAASGLYQQREIQRRSDGGWGVQKYKVNDGPFYVSDGAVALTPSGYSGSITLTASSAYFETGMVNRLFRIFQSGQTVQESFSTAPATGGTVRISGVGSARKISHSVSGSWSGTVHLEVAIDDGSGNPTSWTTLASYTSNESNTYTDKDDNVIKYFRFAVANGGLTSGTVNTNISYSGGSQFGVARVTAVTSATLASAEVLSRFYSKSSSFEWDYSTWSDYDGWPSAVEVFGGRIYWSVGDTIYGSVPDAYKSFDDTVEGDSAPIARSIGSNTQRGILWLLGLQRLIAGTDVSETSIKASSYDEPLTASSWFPVDASTRGCANIRAIQSDKDGIFVQTSRTGAFRIVFDQGAIDYGSADLMAMHEEICDGSPIVDIAIQRRPDTILWFILENGEARALTYEPIESVIAWSRMVTDGQFKRVAASRGAAQDSVYFAVVRNGKQRLERLAQMTDCRGGNINCLADGFSRFTSATPQTTFSVPHLNGLQVTVWADGKAVHDQGNLYTVTANQVVLNVPARNVVIGIPYDGRWQSTKLAYGAQMGTALFQKKRISQLGLYLVHTILDGLRVGYSFDALRKMTTTKDDRLVPPGHLYRTFDADLMSISSDWNTDSRICLEAKSPYPFTASALVIDMQTNG